MWQCGGMAVRRSLAAGVGELMVGGDRVNEVQKCTLFAGLARIWGFKGH